MIKCNTPSTKKFLKATHDPQRRDTSAPHYTVQLYRHTRQRTHPSISRLMKPTDVLPLLSCKQNFRCIWNAAAMCTCASLCAFSCISCPWHLNASHLTLHHVYRSFMCRQIGCIHMPHVCQQKQSLACSLLRSNLMSPHECFHHPRTSLPIAHHLSVKIASHPTTKRITRMHTLPGTCT